MGADVAREDRQAGIPGKAVRGKLRRPAAKSMGSRVIQGVNYRRVGNFA